MLNHTKVDFKLFGDAVRTRYNMLKVGELYTTDVEPDELYAHYLDSFPEGSNEIFRERAEHDCSCCKSFIRNLGGVVGIVDGVVSSLWDIPDVGWPYDKVAKAMTEYMAARSITGIYRTAEGKYGADVTPEMKDGNLIQWTHFSGNVASDHKMSKDAIGPHKSKVESTHQVLSRGLDEITQSATDEVLELIDSNSIYRGEEHRAAVKSFSELQAMYKAAGNSKEVFLWQHIDHPAARFRNTAIGTLLTDLSTGVDLQDAVKMFESKVAPQNYKRPTALITEKMIKSAMATLDELGLRDSIARRHAVVDDISVNDVLYVDNSVQPLMKDGLSDLLMEEVSSKPVKIDDPVEISIEDFLAEVVPKSTSLEVLFENAHIKNLMTLTAPVNKEAPSIFKWGNGFAQSYNGDLADSDLRKNVAERGGRVDGDFRFSHSWNYEGRNASLMDLHVFLPASQIKPDNPTNDTYGNNQRVGWNHRGHSATKGTQDVDYTNEAPAGYVPVENITFPDKRKMPDGDYVCKIHNWCARSPNNAGFKAEIEFGGQVYQYEHVPPLKNKEWMTVAVVTKKGDEFTIDHKMKSSHSSQEKWGLTTQQLVPVDLISLSPNHWGEATGNKHWFFFLKGCKNPDPVRGIYNEYLSNEMAQHRKVFEVLAAKTKAPYQDSQLSGLGFSSTQIQSLTVLSKGKTNRAYRVNFGEKA